MAKPNPFAPAAGGHRRKHKTTWYGVECGEAMGASPRWPGL
jgi:hypothetical protein